MIKDSINLIKNIIIGILIIMCIILLLIVIFYDKVSITKVILEPEQFVLSQQMEEELGDTNIEDTQEVIINYNISSKDLNKYENSNDYDKGKSNPFAPVQNSETYNNDSTSTDNSENFYEDDGTK